VDKAVIERLAQFLPPTEDERTPDPLRPYLRVFEAAAYRGTIAPVKAGWLQDENGRWRVTREGEQAWTRFPDPEHFLIEASRRSMKGWLSVRFPGPYAVTCKAKSQLVTEFKMVRRVGLRKLARQLLPAQESWKAVLPIQRPQRLTVDGARFAHVDQIRAELAAAGLPYREGGHTLYLPPESARGSTFAEVMRGYPEDAGLKILKNAGGIEGSGYIHDTNGHFSWIHSNVTHHHRHLTLLANLFHNADLGPRLYDLVELDCGGTLWSAYCMEHVDGGEPDAIQWEAGMRRIRELDQRGWIRPILPDGYADEEFAFPACGGNALVDKGGRFRYIDFQNFLLLNYESYLKELAGQAAAASHFGESRVLRGGKYLYQAVPGVGLPGKRDPDERVRALVGLMEAAGVTVEGRLVLDVGCNIGMMMAEYLKAGARWCHGWDRASITPHTERLLSAVGGTRFSTTGTDLDESRPIERDLPPFLGSMLDGCVVSYLAVREHIGWLNSLATIPWGFMIYEGHEGETEADLERHLGQLARRVRFRLAGSRTIRDGDSEPRIVAILVRE
jgi:hypothetical protein